MIVVKYERKKNKGFKLLKKKEKNDVICFKNLFLQKEV